MRPAVGAPGPGAGLVPEASEEILTVVLSAVREDERGGYVQRLEAFAEQHRERLEELLRAYGPGSAGHRRRSAGRCPAGVPDGGRLAVEDVTC